MEQKIFADVTINYAGVAQLEEPLTCNEDVARSIRVTSFKFAGMAECTKHSFRKRKYVG
jgi:hypothetical protein